jgi:hypothetical protein
MNSNELKQKSIKEQMEFIFNKIDSDDYLSLREIMLDNYYIPECTNYLFLIDVLDRMGF